MTNEELKKKIVEILNDVTTEPMIYKGRYLGDTQMPELKINAIADALIAAGIGDVTEWKEKAKKHRVQVLPDGTIKQLYSDEEVEDIARQRDEYKHRALVAEKALKIATELGELCAPVEDYIKQAEKEFAEERKDE